MYRVTIDERTKSAFCVRLICVHFDGVETTVARFISTAEAEEVRDLLNDHAYVELATNDGRPRHVFA